MSDPVRVLVIGDAVQPAGPTVDALRERAGERVAVEGRDWLAGDFASAAFAAEGGAVVDLPAAWHDDLVRAEVLITHFFPVSAELVSLATQLELVATLRTGTENIDAAALGARSIPVLNNPGREADAVSDFTVALMLAALRRVVPSDRALRTHGWSAAEVAAARPRNVRELTVGLVGLGHVGVLVARKLRPFGCRLLAADPFAPPAAASAAEVELVGLDELLAGSDVISLHARLSSDTRCLIGARELARVRAGAILVNTARADLVDEDALIAALADGPLGGAALDVFWREPVPAGHPLLQRDDVIVTPHIAGSTLTSQADSVALMATRIADWLDAR